MNEVKDYFDSAHRRVMADFASSSPTNMKEKIEFIRAAVPSAKKTDITTVLQTCDYSVEQAIAALTKDGGRQELEQWTVQGRKSKPRRVMARSKKTPSGREKTPEPTGASDEKEASATVVQQGGESVVDEKPVVVANGYSSHDTEVVPHHKRQDSLSSIGSCGSNTTGGSKEGRKKLLKEINKITTQLSRHQVLQHENFQVAERRIKYEFTRLRQCITDRERELLEMLSTVQSQGTKLLSSRYQMAEKLSHQADNMGSLSEGNAADLRADIKHFLSERKIDEELAKMEWFSGSTCDLEEEIRQFGKVPEIRHLYSDHKSVPSNPSKTPLHTQDDSTHSTKQTVEQSVGAKAQSISHSESNGKQADIKVDNGLDDLKLQAELHAKLKEAVREQSTIPQKQGSRTTNGYVPFKGPSSRSFQPSTKQEVKRQGKSPFTDRNGQDKPSGSHQHVKPLPTKSVDKRQMDGKRQTHEKRHDNSDQLSQRGEKSQTQRDERRQNGKLADEVREKRTSNSDSKHHSNDAAPLPQRQRRQPRGSRQAQMSNSSLQGVASHTATTRD